MTEATEVRLCRDCRHSKADTSSPWQLNCYHPKVNAKDPWALAGAELHGSSARAERESNRYKLWLAPCGTRGALWDPTKETLA
jgi:hypothetical protein